MKMLYLQTAPIDIPQNLQKYQLTFQKTNKLTEGPNIQLSEQKGCCWKMNIYFSFSKLFLAYDPTVSPFNY